MDLSAFVRRYADETLERLREIEGALAKLEADPTDAELHKELMRQAHTVKGGARMLRLGAIQDISHAFEDAMQAAGSGKRKFGPESVDLLFGVTAALRCIAERLGTDDADAHGVDVETVVGCIEKGVPLPPGSVPGLIQPGDSTQVTHGSQPGGPEEGTAPPADAAARRPRVQSVRVAVARLDALGNLTVEMTVERSRARSRHRRVEELGQEIRRVRASTGVSPGSQLGTLFGDLERFHSRLVDECEDELARRAALDHQVRNHVQALRLTPLRTLFDAFPASVREIARGLGKEVELTLSGGDTELDRRIVDEVGEPLVHLLRNALDHGIESKAERERAGKPVRGRLSIRAWAEGGAIHIEVVDDGRGINPESLRRAAVGRGLLDRNAARRLTDEQAVELIFQAGFSTKDQVGEISGRGVGMDSVRVAVARMGGSVSIRSKVGQGTTTHIRLPMTLALLRVLLFRVGQETLALPISAAEWVGNFASFATLDFADDAAEDVLPIIPMAELLQFGVDADHVEQSSPAYIVVQSGIARALFVVDEVIVEAEVALKEPPDWFRTDRLVSGVTVLGDGQPAVVLDPSELMARALARGTALRRSH